MTDPSVWVDPVFWRVTLGGAIRLATPIAFAALGEMIAERTGTLNLSVDAMMTAGVLAAVMAAAVGGWTVGLAAAAGIGLVLGLAMATLTVAGRLNQIVAGIAVSLVGYGLTETVFQLWQPSGQLAPLIPLVPTLPLPALSSIPFLGDVLFTQSLLTYWAVALIALVWLALRFTRLGLVARAVGDDSAAAALRGVAVGRARTLALAFGGAAAGLGGAAITLGFLGSFSEGATAGRGYVAIAVVIIGRWTPFGALLGALLFAAVDSLSLRAQTRLFGWPGEAFSMLPYLVMFIALILTARAATAPRELGRDAPA
jgi:general nucleoside transport system permease protein